METLKETTVADLVAKNLNTAHVFKKYGIDFCCGGKKSIESVCEKNGIDFSILSHELMEAVNTKERSYNYNQWELDFLSDHIVNVHHRYIEESIPLLLSYGDKVTKVHGHHNTELPEIYELVKQVCGELAAHMKKEELILFPFIKKIANAKRENNTLPRPHFGSVDNPVAMMEDEHEAAGEMLREIAELSSQYTPPDHACNTYKAYYSLLNEFEQDLHLHIHLENNILFPKAKQMEKEVIQ